MTVTDNVQLIGEAIVSIADADTELRTLCGRTARLMVPVDELAVLNETSAIAFAFTGKDDTSVDVQFSCFASTRSVANKLVARLLYLFDTAGVTLAAFASHSLDVCSNPARRPNRIWPGAQAEPEDAVQARADVLVSFLIPD